VHARLIVIRRVGVKNSPQVCIAEDDRLVQALATGQKVGGIPFTRGPLAHLLRNRFFIGEVVFKGKTLKGEQSAIIDRALFDAVQARLVHQLNNHNNTRTKSGVLARNCHMPRSSLARD